MIQITTVDGKTYTVVDTATPFYIDASQGWVRCLDSSKKEVRVNRQLIVTYSESVAKQKETKVKKVEEVKE